MNATGSGPSRPDIPSVASELTLGATAYGGWGGRADGAVTRGGVGDGYLSFTLITGAQ
jgi:hypothetical protein